MLNVFRGSADTSFVARYSNKYGAYLSSFSNNSFRDVWSILPGGVVDLNWAHLGIMYLPTYQRPALHIKQTMNRFHSVYHGKCHDTEYNAEEGMMKRKVRSAPING